MRATNIVKGLLLGAVLGGLSISGAAAQEFTFKLHHFLGAQAPAHTEMLEPWAKAVEENSGGRVKIEIFPSMTLGGRPPELIQQARDGVVDLIWTVNGYTAGAFPRSEVFELPFVYVNDLRATNLAMREMFDQHLKEEYNGVEVMFLHVHAGQGIHTRDKEVRRPEDMKGMRMRIPTRTGAWIIEALAAQPVAMPVPELPQALQKGVVDGAFIPWEIILPLKIHEQTEYQIEGHEKARFGNTTFQVSMNKARWDSLPPEIQKAFRDASDEKWLEKVAEIWRATDDHAIKVTVDSGNKHITLTEEETEAFRQALEPVTDRWVKDVSAQGIDGAGLVKQARELMDKHKSASQ
jgi:TRAP-type C4-dicarboxylate transport system substrate-binding protein